MDKRGPVVPESLQFIESLWVAASEMERPREVENDEIKVSLTEERLPVTTTEIIQGNDGEEEKISTELGDVGLPRTGKEAIGCERMDTVSAATLSTSLRSVAPKERK